jgi:UDP-glucose 4-epimerase
MSKILVAGGCGYIGSHTVIDLSENGFNPISADDFSNSHKKMTEGISELLGRPHVNYEVNLCDMEKTEKIFQENPDIEGVIHFAAHIYVPESVSNPVKYYRNNLNNLLNVLDCCEKYGVKNLIFSSSCAVYGNAEELPVTEKTPFGEAECPYARTKQMGEQILRDYCIAHPEFNVVLLRYFNPAGSHETSKIGEAPILENTHLVPIITEVAIGHRKSMTVFGTDYPTRDGSCVRDFIHVMDLAHAHTKAVQFLLGNKNETNCEVFNLGIGDGVTVLEAIKAFEKVTGMALNYTLGERRPGDVAAIYADTTNSRDKLGWTPKRDINDIVKSAWDWENSKGWLISDQ